MTDLYALIHRMADELDHYRQLLMDDRRETHALAAEARAALSEPESEGPTKDELWELWLRLDNELPDRPAAVAEFWEHARAHTRARWGDHPGSPDSSTPQPVSVSERLPRPEDCDADGMCWLSTTKTEPGWVLDYPERCTNYTHWLPAHALPVPSHD